MTDIKDPYAAVGQEIAEELESIARKLPGIPADYRELRSLLALLPDPIASEKPSTGAGDPALFSVGAATPNQSSSTLVGPGPGTTPGSSIGGTTTAPVTTIQTNLIDDAPLDSIGGARTSARKPSYVQLSQDLYGWYEITSGLNPQTTFYTVQRVNPANIFNSGQLHFGVFPVTACDTTASIFGPGLYGQDLTASHLSFAYVIGAVRCYRPAGNTYTNITSLSMTVELWREFNTGSGRESLIAASSVVDMLAMSDSAQSLAKVSAASSNWNAGERASLVVKFQSVASAPGGSLVMAIAEPMLAMNTVQDAPAFNPQLSHWRPVQDDFMAYQFFDRS
jgi:hypothetical protein